MSTLTHLPSPVFGLDLSGDWAPRLPGDSLEQWATVRPDAPAHTTIDYAADRHGVRRTITWRVVEQWSRALAGHLGDLAAPGDRVAILAPQGTEYAIAFFAALRAGVVAVPLFTPDLPGHGDRLEQVLRDCRPSVVITTTDQRESVERVLARCQLTDHVTLVHPESFRGPAGEPFAEAFERPKDLGLDDVAYLQYTSGSTRVPAGVELTHRNLVTNLVQIAQAHHLELPGTTAVSWLPHFHDMGLLLGIAATAVLGVHAVVFDPLAFVMRPSRWMTEVARYGAVMTAAPNFAYALAAKKAKPEEVAALDLSQAVSFVNGAEPVLASTVEAFTRTYAPAGLRDTVLRPSYGLAEATLFVTVGPPEARQRFFTADASGLQRHRLRPPSDPAARSTTLVSCGRPLGSAVAIVDPVSLAVVGDGVIGEVWVHGPSVGRGYFGKPEESRATFGAILSDAPSHGLPDGPWLRTGDLGAIVEADLYLTGRQKDIIIVDGRNLYPHDLELTVEKAHDAIALHRLAAFSVPTAKGEGIVVVAEQYRAALDPAGQLGEITAAARRAVSADHAVALTDFVLVAPDTIPWTSSGKIARRATRQAYLDGALTPVRATAG